MGGDKDLSKLVLDKEKIENLYIKNKLSMNEIAKIFGVSTGTIFNRCKEYGINTRSQKETFTFKGRMHTDKVKKISSATHKGKKLSKETKAKISEGHKKAVYYSRKSVAMDILLFTSQTIQKATRKVT